MDENALMDSMPPLEAVYEAVATLYHSPVDKEKASQWLAELQASVFAWKIADEMLREKRSVEACYFAAQTMRTKIQYSFRELPPQAHLSLRDSLLEHLHQVDENTSSVIMTQLSLAMATFALQMSGWEKPVLDLMSKFNERTCLSVLLEVMTVLPEEVNSRSLRLGENRRKQVIDELTECAPTVNEFLKLCLGGCGDNIQIHVKVLKCFTSWVSIGAICMKSATDNIIVAHAFNILTGNHSSQVHEAATDCLCTLLQCLESNDTLLGQQLYAGVVTLEESYHMSVAHENTDRSMNFCRIFTELGESFLEDILWSRQAGEQHFAVKVFDLVLMCVGHHDYEVAEVTFNLWCRLSEELYKKNNETLTLSFKPYVERLIASLCRHCRNEPDHEGLLDDGEEFADFRSKVSELIKDVVFIVGSCNCFRQMFMDLQAPGVTWDASEAALFVMQAVAKNILPDENEVVPKVVEAILNLPANTHIAVRHTSILLLGELSEWIDLHPQSLEPVLNFLLFGLQQQQLATASATALFSVCSTCRGSMTSHLSGLVQLVSALDSFAVKNEAANGLLRGVVAVLSRVPVKDVQPSLKKICEVQIAPLVQLTKTCQPVEKNKRTDPAVWLDRVTVVLRHLEITVGNGEVHPGTAVLTEMWPVLSAVCDRYQSEPRVIERWCRCIRFAVRCVGRQSAHLLDPIVKQIVSLYAVHKHSSFLYLGSILVDEYACESHCVPKLLQMLGDFIQPTFLLLQEANGLKHHPDTVEDFFRLCTRFLQKLTQPFLECPALPSILECALLSCSLDHRDANAAVMKFFQDLIMSGSNTEVNGTRERQNALVLAIVNIHGKRLVNNLVQASVFSLHTYMLNGVADVIWNLIEYDRIRTKEWLEEALSILPTNNSGGAMTATQTQLEDFFTAVNTARTLKEVTHLLREFARLYR